jgi:hypothetical protein
LIQHQRRLSSTNGKGGKERGKQNDKGKIK